MSGSSVQMFCPQDFHLHFVCLCTEAKYPVPLQRRRLKKPGLRGGLLHQPPQRVGSGFRSQRGISTACASFEVEMGCEVKAGCTNPVQGTVETENRCLTLRYLPLFSLVAALILSFGPVYWKRESRTGFFQTPLLTAAASTIATTIPIRNLTLSGLFGILMRATGYLYLSLTVYH